MVIGMPFVPLWAWAFSAFPETAGSQDSYWSRW
jgi:hypothetical protein